MQRCLHELIEDGIKKYPHRPAVRFQGSALTFAELNDRSNRCARYLRGLGGGPDVIVAVLMERALELPVALLGILKSGSAYLPLDPGYPEERLGFMLEDAGVSVVLTQKRHQGLLRDFQGTVCCLDRDWEHLAAESGENLTPMATPGHLAYVIYTSGSTGKPKGCMLPHQGISNRLIWMQSVYPLGEGDVVLQKTPFTFDVSVWEFFWPLLSGACLLLARPEGHKDPDYLVRTITEEQVTVCHFVPSMLRYFLGHPGVGDCRTLRHVFASGEALSPELMREFQKKLSCKLHNLYGPTEASVDVTYWECAERSDRSVPIGRPISNVYLRILDQEGKEVPPGGEGELHIGGVALARGYLNRPELTREKFIDDPFSPRAGDKLYRTGDLARCHADGNFEYLGRLDFQVKLRGNRIELGEIESVLRGVPGIREAVVLVRDEERGDPKLVAYLVSDGEPPAAKAIRARLKQQLPEYMLPNQVIWIPSLPVTQHGKLDRQVLPWPAPTSAAPAPRGENSREMGAFLLEYLGKALADDRLSPKDDLFDAGASSLTMVALAEEINRRYGVSVPVQVFLDDPTVDAVASYLERQGAAPPPASGPENGCGPADRREDPEPVLRQLREYFREALQAEPLHEEDLFDAGATSLTMVQVAEKIRGRYQVSVPVEVFLETPTLTALAAYVSQRTGADRPATERPPVSDRELAPEEPALIELAKVSFDPAAYAKGAAARGFGKGEISIASLSGLLSLISQAELDGEPKYLYPSAGGLNAVQTYLYLKEGAVPEFGAGLYYYQPERHALVPVHGCATLDASVFLEYDRPAFAECGFALFFIAQLDAIVPVYQGVSQSLGALDAGYMGQLMLSRQSDFRLGLRPVVGVDFDRIAPLFQLDRGHLFLHCLLGGLGAGAEEGEGLALYLRRTGKSPADHLRDPAGVLRLADQLRGDVAANFEKMAFMNQQEHDSFKARKLHLRPVESEATVIPLPRHPLPESGYRLRSSRREYLSQPVSFDRFGKFLALLKPESRSADSRHLYPSLSGMYPVAPYLYVKKGGVVGVSEGIYRYDPLRHVLVPVNAKLSKILKTSYTPFNRKHYQKAAFCLFLFGNLSELEPVYREASLHLALLEAGYLGQLLMDRQAEFDLGICPIGGVDFERVRADFKLAPGEELLHSFTCGSFEQEIPVQHRFLELSRRFAPEAPAAAALLRSGIREQDLAIVGISGRYPGAATLEGYWANLQSGKTSIAELPEARGALWGGNAAEPLRGGVLEDIDCFDSLLFHISPAEARAMDPQERLFLELAWHCLENAGYRAETLRHCGRIGVFVGAMWNEYQQVAPQGGPMGSPSAFHSSLANRVSYCFDFEGPSLAVNTSCVSALTALHLACESIRRGECQAALVGGVNLMTHPYHREFLASLDLLSGDGSCRPFGAGGTGWLPGEGGGALLIKPAREAEAQGDHIHALIKGAAIAHSGRTVRFGAPSPASQCDSMQRALEQAGIDAASISYVEAAAAGASVADASEWQALQQVFAGGGRLLLGSVKGNIGHLESASAFSQVTKVLLQLKHRQIAPALTGATLNPLIERRGGLELVRELTEWESAQAPRRALVNAFGATGSGGHLVLEEYPRREQGEEERPALVPLSAATPAQLEQLVERLLAFLRSETPPPRLGDLAFTLRAGRAELAERLALVPQSLGELAQKLAAHLDGEEVPGVYRGTAPPEGNEEPPARGDLTLVAQKWVTGARIDLESLGGGRRIPLPGYPFAKARHWMAPPATVPAPAQPALGIGASSGAEALSSLENYLTSAFAKVSQLPPEEIDARARLARYGINSVMIQGLNALLERELQLHSKTLFFECQSIEELARHLLERHPEKVRGLLGGTWAEAPAAAEKRQPAQANGAGPAPEIAVIGMSGRYPKAQTLEEFWRLLADGVDCVTEIPPERWDHREYFSEQPQPRGKAYCKSGGFIEDADKFDPRFFGISPREAERMDPQERLFLETAWHTFEDAGYSRRSIERVFQGKVGVFVGVMYSEYQLWNDPARQPIVSSSYGSIANRVSFIFDLHGPSMAVDTLCSSSLTALHLALESIKRGECEAALVGGVNLSLHPAKYLMHSQLNMSSRAGRCSSFGKGGDGFVPGEGVGAVLLKPLQRALADGDQVYGIIRGAGINHGGRTNGYTVPNPKWQAELVARTLRESGVDPRSIGYIEAHGTGTPLGDPIEIAALQNAFRDFTGDRQFCALGSLKSNLGHLESAAGIAGLTKVLLQLKHGKLVPSLYSREPNENIDLAQTPFYLQQSLSEWERPSCDTGGATGSLPRRAALSSFGAGGANAHVLIEEYQGTHRQTGEGGGEALVVLSARSEERLKEQARQLWSWLGTLPRPEATLAQLAYTLQVGREAMSERLALVVGSLEELREKLGLFLESGHAQPGMHRGRAPRGREVPQPEPSQGPEGGPDLEALAARWVAGEEVEWSLPSGGSRVSIPTYPFARERYWISDSRGPREAEAPAISLPPAAELAPPPAAPAGAPTRVRLSELAAAPAAPQPLPAPAAMPMPAPAAKGPALGSLTEELGVSLAEALFLRPEEIDPESVFTDLGMDSIVAVEWVHRLNRRYGTALTATSVYDHPSLADFARLLQGALQQPAETECREAGGREPAPLIPSPAGPGRRSARTLQSLQKELAASLAEALYLALEEIDPEATFLELGLDSILGVEWIARINKEYGLSLSATTVYDHPALAPLASFLLQELESEPAVPDGPPRLSLDGLLQQVQCGKLDLGEADIMLHQLRLEGEFDGEGTYF